jgi:hypothetical protein
MTKEKDLLSKIVVAKKKNQSRVIVAAKTKKDLVLLDFL